MDKAFKLKKAGAEFYVPDSAAEKLALSRTTHMGVSAHQDDIEMLALEGILSCFGKKDAWFFGVVATDGAGSPRSGLYGAYTNEEMIEVRKKEQKKAAYVGEYSGVALLNYSSGEVKQKACPDLTEELAFLIGSAAPDILYTHNPADKHDTHVAVLARTIEAIRSLPLEKRPRKVYGCEVWRNLDWLSDGEKVHLIADSHPNIGSAVLEVHDSQITGGKRYDLAAAGRRLANATFSESHGVDQAGAVSYAMDLTPLIEAGNRDMADYVLQKIEDFKKDVEKRIGRYF